MRWVDHWVGVPVCLILGLASRSWRRLWRIPRAEPDVNRPIAVLKFFGLGSIMQATPMLRVLRNRQPGARLIFITFESNGPLLRLFNICTDVRTIRTASPWSFVSDVLSTIAWLRRNRVGVVIDLEFFSKFSTLLSFLSGAPVRIAFHLNEFWRFTVLTHPINYNYYLHISDLYAQAVERIGLHIDDPHLSRIPISEKALSAVEAFLSQNGRQAGQRLIGINVNAGDLSLERRWPADRFVAVIDKVLQNHADRLVLLTGSKGERDYVAGVANQVSQELRPRVINAAGALSLEEFAAMLEKLEVFLTNDSGPMHIAAAHGVPMISLWGPQRPKFYSPGGADHQELYHELPCSPCLHQFTTFEGMWCNHEAWCMQSIETQLVIDRVERLLDSIAAPIGQK